MPRKNKHKKFNHLQQEKIINFVEKWKENLEKEGKNEK